MSMAVNVTSSPKNPCANLDKARAAFGAALPEWIEVLSRECDRTSQTAVAKRLGVSNTAVSQIISGSYAGVWANIEARARGVYLQETVDCPELGEIGRERCAAEQKKSHRGTSALRTRLYHACRSGCPHSRLKHEGGGHE
jgi:DNA-binding transcriptional regulator YdaS (Cro superfamily)